MKTCNHGFQITAYLSTLAFFPQVAGFYDRLVARFALMSRLALVNILVWFPIIFRIFAHQRSFRD